MKKILPLLLLALLISLPLSASEGFGLIFDEEVSTEEAPMSTSFDIAGKVSAGMTSFIETTDILKSNIDPFADLNFSLTFIHPSLGGNAEIYLPALRAGEVSFKDIVKELSLSYYIPQGKIQAGYFIHRWGVVDTARAVDVINASDFRNGISMDQREMKISEPMVLTQLYFDKAQVEVIYKPIFTPIQMATSGRWDTTPDTFKTLVGGILSSGKTVSYSAPNTATLGYGSFGAKLAMPIGPLDASVMYYRGYYERPGLKFTPLPISPPYADTTIETIYTMMNIIGADVNYVKGSFTLSGEGALYISEDSDETDPYLYNSKLVYIGSVSYMIPKTTSYITASYNGTSILGYQSSNPFDVDSASLEQDHNIIVGVHIPLFKEKLLIEGGLTYQVPTQGYALLSKIDYTLKDDITLSVQGNLFGTFDSSKESLYKMWDDNDSLTISLTYQY